MKLRYTPEAMHDLDEIERYIRDTLLHPSAAYDALVPVGIESIEVDGSANVAAGVHLQWVGDRNAAAIHHTGLVLAVGIHKEAVRMFPEIDFSSALEQIAAIQTFLNGREAQLPGLASMFGEALPEEMVKLTTDLDMTGAQARWDEFAANPGAITTDAVISGYTDAEGVTKPEIAVAAFVSSP